MSSKSDMKLHDEYAKDYDSLAKKYNSHMHALLFGMCYEYIKPGDYLLDIGIGTGLSSFLFAKAGLNISGFDGSAEMLKECEKKGFVKEIIQHNIQDFPLPYPDNIFSIIVCNAVFHSFGDLMPISKEAYRIIKPGGIFAFTIASFTAEDEGLNCKNMPDYIEHISAWNTTVFKHSDKYINEIARKLSFNILKEQKVLTESGEKNTGDILFKIIVLQKKAF